MRSCSQRDGAAERAMHRLEHIDGMRAAVVLAVEAVALDVDG